MVSREDKVGYVFVFPKFEEPSDFIWPIVLKGGQRVARDSRYQRILSDHGWVADLHSHRIVLGDLTSKNVILSDLRPPMYVSLAPVTVDRMRSLTVILKYRVLFCSWHYFVAELLVLPQWQ